MKEFESDTNKWKDCAHRLEKIIVKMFTIPKAVYRFSASTTKI